MTKSWQWRFFYECPVIGCGRCASEFLTPDDAARALKRHLVNLHALNHLIKLENAYVDDIPA